MSYYYSTDSSPSVASVKWLETIPRKSPSSRLHLSNIAFKKCMLQHCGGQQVNSNTLALIRPRAVALTWKSRPGVNTRMLPNRSKPIPMDATRKYYKISASSAILSLALHRTHYPVPIWRNSWLIVDRSWYQCPASHGGIHERSNFCGFELDRGKFHRFRTRLLSAAFKTWRPMPCQFGIT